MQISGTLVTSDSTISLGNAVLAGLNGIDLGTYHRPIDLVIGQQRRAGEIATVFQIGIEYPLSESTSAAKAQIHDQKSQIVDNVDPAEILVEFDAVEDRDPPGVTQHHVAEMHVAMAFANKTTGFTFDQSWLQSLGRSQGPFLHDGQNLAVGRIGQQWPGVGEIVEHRLAHPFRQAKRRGGIGDGNGPVKGGQPAGQRVQIREFQPTVSQRPIQQRVLGKAAHPHRVFDGIAVGAQNRVGGFAANGQAIEIKFRGQSAIQPQFLLTVVFPPLQTGKIQKPQIHGLFDLVGIVSSQQNMRNMSL